MKKRVRLIFSLFLILSEIVFAQDGALDLSFNSGRAFVDFGVEDSSVHSLVVQPDGKILAGGSVFNQGDYSQFALARFNSNGTLDTTFGVGGLVIGDFLDFKISLNSLILQPDGKIVAEGIIYNNYTDSQFVMTRFNSDGTFDTTFGNAGIVVVNFLTINAMILQPDGKILVAGFSFDTLNRDFEILRYTSDGVIDTSFGTNGSAVTSISTRDFVYDITLQTDGKIVVAGATQNNNNPYFSDFVVARYLGDGNLDASFGINGIVIVDVDAIDEARSVQMQDDGKIIFAGWSFSVSGLTYSYRLFRLLPDGSVDSSFGIDGNTASPIFLGGNEQIIALQADSKIILGGAAVSGDTNDFALVRFLSNGTLDTTFGAFGVSATSDGPNTRSKANAVVLQSDGRILVGGETGEAYFSYHPNYLLRRYYSGLEPAEIALLTHQRNPFSIETNTAGSKSKLAFTLDKPETLSVKLQDSNGKEVVQLVRQKRFSKGYNSQTLHFPEKLPNGVYFLCVSNGETVYNLKINR